MPNSSTGHIFNLDLLIKRNEFKCTAQLLTKINYKELMGFTSPLVFANVYYINTKYEGKNKALENLRKLCQLLSILTIDESIIDDALIVNATDFED